MTTIWKKKSDTQLWGRRKTVDRQVYICAGYWEKQTVVDFDRFWCLTVLTPPILGLYKGFPWPHRGIETITYLVSGTMEHEDSPGKQRVIQSMGCQWMTTSSGILHKEMPQPSERMLRMPTIRSIYLLQKMVPHRHIGHCSGWHPGGDVRQGTVRILSGNHRGYGDSGQFHIFQITYLDVTLPADASWEVQRSTLRWNPISLLLEGSLFPRNSNLRKVGVCAILFCSCSWRRYGRTGRGEKPTGKVHVFVVGSSWKNLLSGEVHSDE